MERVLVVGAGFMGMGIGQVCAQAGYHVHLSDVSEKALDRASVPISFDSLKATV